MHVLTLLLWSVLITQHASSSSSEAPFVGRQCPVCECVDDSKTTTETIYTTTTRSTYEGDNEPSWCGEIRDARSGCTCDMEMVQGYSTGNCTSRWLQSGSSCAPDVCADSTLGLHSCESTSVLQTELVSDVRCVNEEEFLKELPQIAYVVVLLSLYTQITRIYHMYLSWIFLENHANTNRYDVPMAINTDECGDDMATCGEKLLSSGCVRDALNLTIAKIANVKTKDVLTIGLTIADNENNGNVDSSTRRQRRLYYDDSRRRTRDEKRSLRYLASTTTTTTTQDKILKDFNLEFTIQYMSLRIWSSTHQLLCNYTSNIFVLCCCCCCWCFCCTTTSNNKNHYIFVYI